MSHHQPERPQENLGWLLATVSHAFTTELTAALEAVSVTPRAHCVLATALQGEYTQTALAQAIGARQDDDGRDDRRAGAGRAGRAAHVEHDRRARVIAVTEAGRRKVARGRGDRRRRSRSDVLDSLPARSATALMAALQRSSAGRLRTAAGARSPCAAAGRVAAA